ncbi:hypothetical protein ACQCVP_07935 [Rossellomorea vietnamensis]|uniref:hypothetical protein n=1 Tax=Rossellomorea vietnamensis TaxID=218284 RepID=UPI003CF86596
MWLVLGVMAIAVTFINLYMFAAGKDYKLAMAMGLSFTALTLCAELSFVSELVLREDLSALSEVPNYDRELWFLTIASILLNIAPIFLERKAKKKLESK